MEKEKTKTQEELLKDYERRFSVIEALTPNRDLIDNKQIALFIAELFEKVNVALSKDKDTDRVVKFFIFNLLTLIFAYGLGESTSMAAINNVISDFVKQMNKE